MTTRALVSDTASLSPFRSKKRSAERAGDDGCRNQQDAGRVRVRGCDRGDGASVVKVRVCERDNAVGFGKRPHARQARVSGDASAEEAGGQTAVRGDYDGGVERASRSQALQEAVSQGVRQAQLLQQQKQTPPQQAPAVRWERFLPQRQLRVLLVEDDDSTRHVVSALLRNCSYEVTSAATGLLAWDLLTEQTSQLDLVLTEVVMPGLSGIGLLSRIMGHKALKHIPVIMMSSHDSMGIVFKCLSKGAVDFLVKPVRKNELKNLWQHVWRRCRSSSDSGRGNGSQTWKVSHPDGAADCNNSVSNDESENTSSGLNARGGSDNGSGTQSSWTKRAVEVESSHQHANCELMLPNAGLVQHASTQAEKGSALPVEHYERIGFDISDHALGRDFDIATLRLAAYPSFSHKEEDWGVVGKEAPATAYGERRQMEEAGSGSSQDDSRKAIDLIGGITCKDMGNDEEQQGENADGDDLLEKHANNSPSSKEKVVSGSSSPCMLELTLKRPRPSAEDDRERGSTTRGLRHSCSSAFSRYNSTGNHMPISSGTLPASTRIKPAGYGAQPFTQGSGVGSNSPSSTPLTAQMQRFAPTEGSTVLSTPLPYSSHVSHVNNKQDSGMPPTFPPVKDNVAACLVKEESMPLPQVSGAETPLSPGKVHCGSQTGHGPNNQAMFYGRAAAPPWGSTVASVAERGETDDCCVSYDQSQSHPTHPDTIQQSQVHHHSHHHSHHHHHHVQHHFHYHQQHASQQRPMTPQQEGHTVTNAGAGAPICGSSNMANGSEGNNGQSGSSNNNGNVSLNGSATGSNNGCNGHSNGQSAVALPAGGNGDNITQLKLGGEGTAHCLALTQGVQFGPDQNRFARREAALTKFRQKRKERCFEKKVRYQSRKRLAEQRPRVRGQFVRQSVYDFAAGEPE